MSKKYDFSDFDDAPKYDFSDFEENKNEPSAFETVVGKFANGGSLGFVDELSGGLESIGQAAGISGLGGKLRDIKLSDEGPTLDIEKLKKAYVTGRDNERINQDEMSQANPVLSGFSELAGGIATFPASGGATTLARVGQAARLGGIAGLGSSQADLTKGEFLDASKDIAVGGALGGALQFGGEKIIAPVAQKIGQSFKNNSLTKGLGKVLAGVDAEDTQRYLDNHNKINSALEMEDIGHYFKDDVLNQFQRQLSDLDTEAWKALNTQPSINKQEILSIGDDFVQKIIGGKNGQFTRSAGTGADADKLKAIYSQLDEIKTAFGSNISESDLKSIVQNLQKLGYSLEGSPKSSLQGQALRELSGVYNEVLKSVNPVYAEKMIPVQEATNTLTSLNRKFMNGAAPDEIDTFLRTAKRIGSLSDDSEALRSLRTLDNKTGAGIEGMIKDRLAQDSFYKNDTNGSRKTLAGAIFGKAAEGAIGGAIGYGVSDGSGAGAATGAIIGMSLDKYAGQVFKKILDGQIKAGEGIQKIAPQLGKFAKPLMEAASRGNEAVAATHFILQQQNPEYRKLLQGEDK